MNQAHIARKVRWAFDEFGLSRQLVQERCGFSSKSTINGWKKTGRIAKNHLPVLAELTGTNLNWWHDPDAPVPPNPSGLDTSEKQSGFPVGSAKVAQPVSHGARKVLSSVAVRFAARLVEGAFVDLETAQGSVAWASVDDQAFAVRCIGDAMSPRIEHGEFVLVEPSQPAQAGRDVYVRLIDGRVAIRRLMYERDGRVHLESINKSHPPEAIDEDQIAAMHPITARLDSGRYIASP